jgi:cell wall-associated NlpC family hydrolase
LSAYRRLLRAAFIAVAAVGIVAPAAAAHAEPSPAELTTQIEKSSADLEKIVEQYNKVTEELKASEAAATDLRTKLAPLESHLNSAYTSVGKIAATAYKSGPTSPMMVLLNSDASAQYTTLASLTYLARTQQQDISGYAELKAQYSAQQKQIDEAHASQAAKQRELTAQKDKINNDLQGLYELRRKAYGSATNTASSSAARPAAPYVAGRAGAAVSYAYRALGKPYVWAAEGPNGYDCSGLTLASWKAAGLSLPHNAAMQWNSVSHISRGALQPGDLVFYSGLGHVGIYVGGNQIIHAPTFGESVKLASVDVMSPYGFGRPG